MEGKALFRYIACCHTLVADPRLNRVWQAFLNMIRWIIFAWQQSLILSIQEAVNSGALYLNPPGNENNVHYVLIYMNRVFLSAVVLAFMLSSCKEEFMGHSGFGKSPIYVAYEELNSIGSMPAQTVEQSGPIFLIGDFFFMIETGKGIHVFDISDDQTENSLVFIKIPAVTDFTIDGNFLYADSWKDLVSLDISDIYNVVFLNRTEDVFDPFLFPLLFNGPFECVDESRGAVIGWEDKQLENVLCHTTN